MPLSWLLPAMHDVPCARTSHHRGQRAKEVLGSVKGKRPFKDYRQRRAGKESLGNWDPPGGLSAVLEDPLKGARCPLPSPESYRGSSRWEGSSWEAEGPGYITANSSCY